MEERFFDNELMVSGQPDLVAFIKKKTDPDSEFKLTVLDWKSSKKPSQKHKIQVGIYAKNCQWDGKYPEQAIVVAFGAVNKQGYSMTTVKKDQITNIYNGMKALRKVIDLCAVQYGMKFYEG